MAGIVRVKFGMAMAGGTHSVVAGEDVEDNLDLSACREMDEAAVDRTLDIHTGLDFGLGGFDAVAEA